MKKQLTLLFTAAALVMGLTACGDDSSVGTTSLTTTAGTTTATTSATTAQTTTTAKTTKAASTTAATTKGTGTATTAAGGKVSDTKMQALLDAKGNTSWTVALLNRLATAEHTYVSMQYSAEGVTVQTSAVRSGKNSYVSMSLGGSPIITIADGQTVYTVDDESRSFSKTASTESADADSDTLTLGMKDTNVSMQSSGLETVEGKVYIYEELPVDPAESSETARYYFDQDKNLKYCAQTENGTTQFINMDVNFEKPLAALFTVPTGYKEISSEDMAMITMGKLFGSLGALSGAE